ncbi:MAG: endonuclease/exonuclease/phosphatase family protein [Gemmatimonadaceae bacterium]|nr:endonuclease/exonuclease/phosphatase family protein [Gemmatimonadaceae bacterium]
MLVSTRAFVLRALTIGGLLVAAGCQSITDGTPLTAPERATYVVVPPEGTATSLDVANWNIEWFGDAANGPTNETLQQSNVKDVIAGTDADIWGLEEVVSATAWATLKAGLPGYAGILSNDANVVNGSAYYSSTEQKVALLYKTSIATLQSAKIILTANDYDFAGRPPMEVKLSVVLNGTTEDLVVIVLHMKAFNDDVSWQRRQNAGIALKSYLDTTYPTQKVMVIGDWNDDVDTSITPGKPTPYANFVSDTARYRFPTKALTDAGISSSVNYPDMIDHQLETNEQLADYIAGSVKVIRADQYIASYGTTTTDHYPVLSRYTPSGGVPAVPSITVTSPNGGETWNTSSAHNITWTSSSVSTVNLDYTVDGGTTWASVATGVNASTGSYAWTVPNTTTTSAKVRVTDAASATTDASNATFTIATPPPAPPVANFTYVCSTFTCSFDASSSTGATSYSWAFGDGGTGAGVTTSHTFGRGTFTVTLTVTGASGSSSSAKAITCNGKRCS